MIQITKKVAMAMLMAIVTKDQIINTIEYIKDL